MDEKTRILDEIDEVTGPDLMSKEEALEWLQDLISDLESKAEALEMEIEDEE